MALAGACALAAFLIANPYALLDYHSFHAELVHQSSLSAESQGKLGAPKEGGLVYYLWSFTWGLGWVPALAALGGALAVWRHERRVGWLLVPAAVLFLAFMGLQGRYFGRWLMPIFPIACLLGAFFVVALARWAARPLSEPAPRAALAALLVAALLVQGLVYSVHAGIALSRADTRNLTRQWMLAHIPAGAKIVAEPVEPEEWAREVEAGTSTAHNPYRWRHVSGPVPAHQPEGHDLAGVPAPSRPGELRDDAASGADRLLRARRLLLGAHRLDRVRARVRRPARGAARDRLLPRARTTRDGRISRLALRARPGAGRVQLRLELRLLPARLRPARPADDRLPPARRALPRREVAWRAGTGTARGYPG